MVGMGNNAKIFFQLLADQIQTTMTEPRYVHHRRQQQLDSQFLINMTTLIASLLLFTTAAVLPAATSLSIQQDLSEPNNGVYTSSRRYLLRSMSAASVSLGPVVAASSAIKEEEDPSVVERPTLKIGGVNVVGWAAAAVILNDVLSNRFSVDSIWNASRDER